MLLCREVDKPVDTPAGPHNASGADVLQKKLGREAKPGSLAGGEIAFLGACSLEQEVPVWLVGRTIHAQIVTHSLVLCKKLAQKAWDTDRERIIEREHALIKLEVPGEDRAQLLQLITALQVLLVDSSGDVWVIEVTGESSSVESAINLLSQYRVIETIRTGRIALERGRGSGVGGAGGGAGNGSTRNGKT